MLGSHDEDNRRPSSPPHDRRPPPRAAPVRVLLVDVHPMYRAGLSAALATDDSLLVVGEATTALQVGPAVASLRPEFLLLREAGGASRPLDVLRELAEAGDGVRTVLIAAPREVVEMPDAVRLGVVGILPPDMDARLLLQCMRAVASGQLWLPRDSIASVVRSLGAQRRGTPDRSRPFGLTQRELDVVMAVAEGFTNRDIAERFSIKEDTVKHHVSAAFDKTGTFSRVELALFALHHHLGRHAVPPDGRP